MNDKERRNGKARPVAGCVCGVKFSTCVSGGGFPSHESIIFSLSLPQHDPSLVIQTVKKKSNYERDPFVVSHTHMKANLDTKFFSSPFLYRVFIHFLLVGSR